MLNGVKTSAGKFVVSAYSVCVVCVFIKLHLSVTATPVCRAEAGKASLKMSEKEAEEGGFVVAPGFFCCKYVMWWFAGAERESDKGEETEEGELDKSFDSLAANGNFVFVGYGWGW